MPSSTWRSGGFECASRPAVVKARRERLQIGAMAVLHAAVVAGVIAALLYWRFDSGIVMPEPAPRLTSLPLLGLALIFGLGAWAASKSSFPKRAPWFAGLAAGVGAYALVRLFAFT